MNLTEKEILEIAAKHCEFSCEGTYHLNKYTGWAIVAVVRECFELAALCDTAEAGNPAQVELPIVMYWVDGAPLVKLADAQAAILTTAKAGAITDEEFLLQLSRSTLSDVKTAITRLQELGDKEPVPEQWWAVISRALYIAATKSYKPEA